MILLSPWPLEPLLIYPKHSPKYFLNLCNTLHPASKKKKTKKKKRQNLAHFLAVTSRLPFEVAAASPLGVSTLCPPCPPQCLKT